VAGRRLSPEIGARLAVGAAVVGVAVVSLGAQRIASAEAVTLHARMSEGGGWTPETLRVGAGRPLALRLISDDVVHGFAVGQSPAPSIDLEPGLPVETTLTFDEPGKYVFYCTRWCGPDHWRMRGVIEVTGAGASTEAPQTPLFVQLGIDLDAPHPAPAVPASRPSAARGAALALPETLTSRAAYETRTPGETWLRLRRLSETRNLSDDQVWDLTAWLWRSNTSATALAEGAQLFAQNCAACHGEAGQGDGVMADSIAAAAMPGSAEPARPVDFTNASAMLGASPALLHGKISRGGMGTGMPYWGPILTDEQIWSLVDFLWTFQFEE
jgi:cytochrome c oxidase subunit 2